jgi:SAM-dependent methyltransferase
VDSDFARHYYEAARADHWWFLGRKELIKGLIERTGARSGLVLDLGAGSHTLFPAEFSVVNVDVARPKGELGRFVQASATCLPFQNRSFLGIGAFDVIEHIGEVGLLMDELRRVLEPGGFVLATAPAYQRLWSQHDSRVGHVRRYDITSLKALFEQAGFDVMWCGTFYGFLLIPAVVRSTLGLSPGMGKPHVVINRILARIAEHSARSALKRKRPGLSVGLAAALRLPE